MFFLFFRPSLFPPENRTARKNIYFLFKVFSCSCWWESLKSELKVSLKVQVQYSITCFDVFVGFLALLQKVLCKIVLLAYSPPPSLLSPKWIKQSGFWAPCTHITLVAVIFLYRSLPLLLWIISGWLTWCIGKGGRNNLFGQATGAETLFSLLNRDDSKVLL